jgi:hypothetical protein
MLLGLVAGAAEIAVGQCSWSPLGTGMAMAVGDPSPATAATMAVFDDGNGPALYVGGVFTAAGGVTVSKVAKWNGSSWSDVGGGMEYNSLVLKLAVYNGALYAAGTFNTAGGQSASRIAKWDGQAWSPLGVGLNGQANALAVFDDGSGRPALFVGGTFTTAGGITVNRIAKWDGVSWSALTTGLSSFANVITTYNGALYVGGNFTSAGGVPATRIAKWDGTTWSAVGTGATGAVNDFAAFDAGGGTALYAGGSFGIIKWDGATWTTVPGGPGASALLAFNGALYTTGGFVTVGTTCANNIAKWDGTTWSPLASGLYSNGNAMAVFNGDLHVSGQFLSASGVAGTTRIARWSCP